MKNKSYQLAEYVRTVSSGINVYSDILNTSVKSELEKENSILKLQLIRDEILKSSMNIKKTIEEIKMNGI